MKNLDRQNRFPLLRALGGLAAVLTIAGFAWMVFRELYPKRQPPNVVQVDASTNVDSVVIDQRQVIEAEISDELNPVMVEEPSEPIAPTEAEVSARSDELAREVYTELPITESRSEDQDKDEISGFEYSESPTPQ